MRLFCSGVGFVANTGWYRKRLDEAFLADRQIIADQRFSHLLDPRSYSPKSQFVVIALTARACALHRTSARWSMVTARYCKRIGADPQSFALEAGEDFELLVAIEPRAFTYLATRFRALTGRVLLGIGELTAEPGLRSRDGAPVVARGHDHLAPR